MRRCTATTPCWKRGARSRFRIKRIAVRNLNKHRETAVPEELLTDDWHELVGDPEIDIIIELIGGTRAGL